MQHRRFSQSLALLGLSVLSAIVVYLMAFSGWLEPSLTSARPKSFAMTQFLYYAAKPNLEKYGFQTMFQLGQHYDYWVEPFDTVNFPNEQKTRSLARTAKPDRLYYVDIEHLTFKDVATDTKKMSQIGQWIREEQPNLKFGFYGMPPMTAPWDRPASWRELNAKLHSMVKNVDFVMPDLYTVHTDPKLWLAQAKETIAEARQYKKPIYAFIMPFYHPGAGEALTGKPIPAEYWRLQLETLYQSIDGIVIWSWSPEEAWKTIASETDPKNWWYQTLDFMKQKGLLSQSPDRPT